MKNIIITGSSGRIGRALHWLLSQKYSVKGLDLTPSSATTEIVDIRDYEQLVRNFEGCDTVFHAAALHAPHVGIYDEQAFREINVMATEQVCKAALSCGVSQLIFTSTTALYGYANEGKEEAVWINEQTRPKPKTIYHQTKWEAEQLLETYAGKHLAVSVIRMSRCFPEPVPLMAVYRLHRGVDYRDVAEAHHLAAQLREKKYFDTYVISGHTPFLPTDVKRLAENPEELIRERQPQLAREFDKRGWKLPDRIDRVYDSSYAERSLHWKPKRDAFEVLKQWDSGDFEVLPPVKS